MNVLLGIVIVGLIVTLIVVRYKNKVAEEESLHMTETKKDVLQEKSFAGKKILERRKIQKVQ